MKKLDKTAKNHLLIGLVLFLVMLVIGIVLHVVSINKVKKDYNLVNQEMSDRINSATRVVYKALADISQGETITEDLVTVDSSALCDDRQDLLITSTDIGKVSTVAIKAGEIIKTNMVSDPLEKNWQETELNCIWLSTNLKQYDYVDIRILYPDGTDYVVVPKKSIQKLRLANNNVFLWLSEDEILNLDSAIVDANLHKARIYTTKYVKPEVEEASKITYQPSASIIDLLNSDPNVLNEAKQHLSKSAREGMEQKLEEFKNAEVKQSKKEADEEYNFSLDTTTNGSTRNKSDNNNGYTPPEDEVVNSQPTQPQQNTQQPAESARNGGGVNEQ